MISGKIMISRNILLYQAAAFIGIIFLIWLNEWLDIPYSLLGAERTLINWRESFLESALVAMLGASSLFYTHAVLRRLKYLEGILPICASCKRIRDEVDQWHSVEAYVSDRSEAQFSHGICPECFEKLYPDISIKEE